MPERTSAYPPDLGVLQNTLWASWHDRHVDVPAALYHYTTADGLIGILRSQCFWMTSLRHMNDLSELQYATDLVAGVLAARAAQSGVPGVVTEFLNGAARTINPFESGIEIFAICFCENGNLLSQWRAYGSQGGGYAVGFDLAHFPRLLPYPCALRKVIYDAEEQRSIVGSALDGLCALVQARASERHPASSEELRAYHDLLSRLVSEYVLCFKHPDFEQEQEWRLVSPRDSNLTLERRPTEQPLKFRAYAGNVIPYFELSLTNAIEASTMDDRVMAFPLVELVVGPTLSRTMNEQSTRLLLNSISPHFYPFIRHSAIPLRWL